MPLAVSIVPESLASSSKFLRLPHPRTGQDALFLPNTKGDAEDELLEFQAVEPPAHAVRSYFVENRAISDGRLFFLTKFDTLFLIIPIMLSLSSLNCVNSTDPLAPYPEPYTVDSIIHQAFSGNLRRFYNIKDKVAGYQSAESEGDLVGLSTLSCFRRRIREICDTQVIEGTELYRFSIERMTEKLRQKLEKIEREIFRRIPTLELKEESLIDKQGDTVNISPPPMKISELSVDAYPSIVKQLLRDGLWGEGAKELNEDVLRDARQRTALETLSNYLPYTVTAHLRRTLFKDFPALTVYQSEVKVAESLAASNIGLPTPPLSVSTSLTLVDESGKKRSKKGGRGVETLKKVNVDGMKKLDSFFAKGSAEVKVKGALKKGKGKGKVSTLEEVAEVAEVTVERANTNVDLDGCGVPNS